MEHDLCLNIDCGAPDEIWQKIGAVYRSMPYWDDTAGFPHWTGEGIDLCTSAEPGGIQIMGTMPEDIWDTWFSELTAKLTDALGYEIGDPCDGFSFKYWKPFVKRHADIKTVNKTCVIFKDWSQFDWQRFDSVTAMPDAEPVQIVFSSPLIELHILFDQKGMFARRSNQQEMRKFLETLATYGIHATE